VRETWFNNQALRRWIVLNFYEDNCWTSVCGVSVAEQVFDKVKTSLPYFSVLKLVASS